MKKFLTIAGEGRVKIPAPRQIEEGNSVTYSLEKSKTMGNAKKKQPESILQEEKDKKPSFGGGKVSEVALRGSDRPQGL